MGILCVARRLSASGPDRKQARVARRWSGRDSVEDARASYQSQVELALSNANARRVAVLADKLGLLASF